MEQQRPPVDMIVPLLALPSVEPQLRRLADEGIFVRRTKAWEQPLLRQFISTRFAPPWAEEASIAFANKPVSAFLAFHGIDVVGFAVYECTFRGVFGPIGVEESFRNRDVATALLLKCLESMRAEGYIYAVIGQAGPREFFEKACGAMAVPENWPSYLMEG